jgi:glycosyltransferase involved in cell wall biosynthesis
MATIHDWGSPLRLGCHHLAAGLVEAGCDVAFVSSAISPVQVLRDRSTFLERRHRRARGGESHYDGRLWAYTPWSLLTPHNAPILRSRSLHRDWHRLTLPNVVRTVRKGGFGTVDLLYIDAPTQLFWLDEVEHGTSVARIGDRHAGFPGVSDQVLQLEGELIRSVDVVACSAYLIMDDVTAAGAKRTLYLPNGVDFGHFNSGDRSIPADLAAISRPVVMYVGEMAHWFDFQLMNELAVVMPEVSFVYIGPERMALASLVQRDNVHILGRRPFDALPGYLWNADVGLIPFDVERHASLVNAVHPLKLYEYLACGLPVVATRWDELERLHSPARLCEGTAQFTAALRSAITERPDPAAGIDFARQADWSNRVRLLLDMTLRHEATST